MKVRVWSFADGSDDRVNSAPSARRSISNVDPRLNVVSAGSYDPGVGKNVGSTYDHLAILSQDLELLRSTITESSSR